MTDRTFDAIVVGGGPAGEVCAGKLAGHGLETALVERELVGGECSFYACMPSKALLRPGELAAETRRVAGVTDAAVEPIAALRRRDEVIHGLDDSGQEPWLQERGIALLRGDARLDGERRLVVSHDGGEQRLTARRAVVLATGSDASIPPVPGLREIAPWTNREITTAQQVPPRLLVLGGGVVGVEMAQAWASFGAHVTLVEVGERLIAQEEELASELVADGLRDRGVDVRLGAEASGARRDPDAGETILTLAGGAGELRAEVLLVAAGRAPRTHGLGLETVGLEPGRAIEVDARMRVPGRDWLYAIGDVNGRALLTHEGKLQARIAALNAAGRGAPELRDTGPPPRVIFTAPQVAASGHTLASAREAGIAAEAVDGRIDAVAGASFRGKGADARARFVVDPARRVLVGATFVGPDVAELVHAASIAIAGEVPVERLVQAAPAFPTLSEAWLKLADWAGT